VAKSFLGKGWKFPVEVDRAGGVATAEDEAAIRQSIHVIIGTAPGERVMRPYFGCQIHELLYAPNNMSTASLAAHFAKEALTKWEPRIAEVEVQASPNDDEPNRLDLSVSYRVRSSNASRNLVYPFYLRRSDET
jgi:phage baseplate assembly protein W